MKVSGAASATRYFHTDNLGSISVITDETGAVVPNGRQGYDAWGKRRWPNGADDTGSLPLSQTTRGFTGQEELSDVGLVHLNGRIYDPLIARMTSADPMVPDPLNGQAWNRYSYVVNNPLAFTDPSGYCFLGLCRHREHFQGIPAPAARRADRRHHRRGGRGSDMRGRPRLRRHRGVPQHDGGGRHRDGQFKAWTEGGADRRGNCRRILGSRELTDQIADGWTQAKDTFNRNSARRRMRSTSQPMPRLGARRPSRLAASAAPPLWPAASPRPQDP